MSSHRLFGTDGVRGVVNVDLTPEFTVRLSLAIASYFKNGSRIVVGRDYRAGSEFISKIVIGSLVSAGVKVYDAGLTPTPALQYYVKSLGFDGGIMITASHNPPEYSGIKVVMSDGIEAPREVEEEIESYFHELRFRRIPWHELRHQVIRLNDVNDFYVEGILKLVDVEKIRRKPFKVIVDPANNVGGLTTPKLLRKLNVKVVTVNSDLSVEPYREPEPIKENINYLSDLVRFFKADFAVAHDGDADRAIFVDDEGNIVLGDRSAVILCKHLILNRNEKSPKRVVTAVSSSTVVEDILSRYGVEVLWTKVGSVIIARTMLSIGALAGFEENGGFMYPPHQYVRDGAMSTALMLEYLAMSNRKLSEAHKEIPARYVVKAKVPLTNRSKLPDLIDTLKSMYSTYYRVIDVDGVKVITDSYWFLVRPSGTEPLIRVFVEGSDEGEVNETLNNLKQIIKEVLG
ncbi:MAG: phosphoglucosamine mutase [Zestosphaera tikiterensis]|uniref:Phosphoglucosamine mutase n=1 Tax=Zestosphaera tikiterensis TaxID=1973259 RepID=A0A2R7Y3J3_9CREN|nr:MAG: phosphoglucosamine mutase [Zestosphaera tikiterensis]